MNFDIFPISNGRWVCQIEKEGENYLLSMNIFRELLPRDCFVGDTVYYDLPELLEDIGAYIDQMCEESGITPETHKHQINISHEIPEWAWNVEYDLSVGMLPENDEIYVDDMLFYVDDDLDDLDDCDDDFWN